MEGRLAIEVRVENDPTGPYEHAGLLRYYDDDNDALLRREKVAGKPIIQLVNEIEGKPKAGFAERPWSANEAGDCGAGACAAKSRDG